MSAGNTAFLLSAACRLTRWTCSLWSAAWNRRPS